MAGGRARATKGQVYIYGPCSYGLYSYGLSKWLAAALERHKGRAKALFDRARYGEALALYSNCLAIEEKLLDEHVATAGAWIYF